MGNLSSDMHRLVEAVRFSADARRLALEQLRAATGAALRRYRRGRQEMALETRQSARRQVEEIRRVAGELRRSTRLTLGGIASDIRAATELWSTTPPSRASSSPAATRVAEKPFEQKAAARAGGAQMGTATPPVTAGGKQPAATPAGAAAASEPERQSSPTERERVLRIIQAHVDGVRLVDIGNELGVDWRSLIGITKSLLEEGKIEKIESLYYPVQH